MQDNRKLKRKVRNSYIISTVSIAMVLFLLASVAYLIIGALNASNRMRESVEVYVVLKDGTTDEQRTAVRGRILAVEGVRDAKFVSKEEAARQYTEGTGEDFSDALGFNPLPDTFTVKMDADSDGKQTIKALEAEAAQWPEADEVWYHKNIVEQLGTNLNKFNLVLLLFGVSLLFISLVLLNNTIRVSIFSKRYIINTMKLVGADKWFVMKPFLGSAVLHGVYAALIATLMFAGMVAGLNEGLPEVQFVSERVELIWIVAGIFLLGILISLLFTFFAVNKFVRMRTNAIHLY